jgi:hypothetical protein
MDARMGPFDALARPSARSGKYLRPVDGQGTREVRGVGDAHFRVARTHDVGAVISAGEPASHRILWRLDAGGDVLADRARLVPGALHAAGWRATVVTRVFELAVPRHVLRMFKCRGGQWRREAEWWHRGIESPAAPTAARPCRVDEFENALAHHCCLPKRRRMNRRGDHEPKIPSALGDARLSQPGIGNIVAMAFGQRPRRFLVATQTHEVNGYRGGRAIHRRQ